MPQTPTAKASVGSARGAESSQFIFISLRSPKMCLRSVRSLALTIAGHSQRECLRVSLSSSQIHNRPKDYKEYTPAKTTLQGLTSCRPKWLCYTWSSVYTSAVHRFPVSSVSLLGIHCRIPEDRTTPLHGVQMNFITRTCMKYSLYTPHVIRNLVALFVFGSYFWM